MTLHPDQSTSMRFAYTDPPYPGMSGLYKDHPDYGGEVDHGDLVERMCDEYDGFALHTASTTLREVLAVCPSEVRIGAWVKPFASWKPNVTIAYAWEPVIFWSGRPRPKDVPTLCDWIACSITLQKGLTGAKPPEVCRWAFDMLGAEPTDDLDDLFPGSGAVSKAWAAWCAAPQMRSLYFTGHGTAKSRPERIAIADAS